jgi:hypothetical protein
MYAWTPHEARGVASMTTHTYQQNTTVLPFLEELGERNDAYRRQ